MFKTIFTVVFLNESEDEQFCGSLSLGMILVNFSLIDEESQGVCSLGKVALDHSLQRSFSDRIL